MRTLRRISTDLDKLRRLTDRLLSELNATDPAAVPVIVELQISLADALDAVERLREVIEHKTEP